MTKNHDVRIPGEILVLMRTGTSMDVGLGGGEMRGAASGRSGQLAGKTSCGSTLYAPEKATSWGKAVAEAIPHAGNKAYLTLPPHGAMSSGGRGHNLWTSILGAVTENNAQTS